MLPSQHRGYWQQQHIKAINTEPNQVKGTEKQVLEASSFFVLESLSSLVIKTAYTPLPQFVYFFLHLRPQLFIGL